MSLKRACDAGPTAVAAAAAAADDIPVPEPAADIYKAGLVAINRLPRLCKFHPNDVIKVDDIRDISNEFCASGDPSSNAFGMTNMGTFFPTRCNASFVATQLRWLLKRRY